MNIKIRINTTDIMVVAIVLLTTLASLFYLVPANFQLIIIFAFGITLFLPIFSLKEVKGVPLYILLLVAMIFFYVNNNPRMLSVSTIRAAFIYILCVCSVLVLQYHEERWIKRYVYIATSVYLFYAFYTIAMYFFPQLFEYTLQIFPNQARTLISQYKQGCMPGLTNHYSTNGMVVVMAFIMTGSNMIYYWKEKHIWKLLCFLSLLGLLFTGKRAHIVFGAVALFVVYYFYMSNNQKSRLFQMIAILVLALAFLFILINYVPALSTFINRFAETAEEGDVLLGRTKMWKIALDNFKMSPLVGIGWGHFIKINIHAWNAHNIYLQLLCETGIIGFSVYVFFFGYFLFSTMIKLIRCRQSLEDRCSISNNLMISLGIQVFFLLYGFTGNPLYDKEMYGPYLLACAISAYYRNDYIQGLTAKTGEVQV